MKPSSLIRIAAELTGEFRASGAPADRCAAGFFRSRRYLGAKDRRVIGDLFYHLLRHLRRIDEALDAAIREAGAKIAEDAGTSFTVTQNWEPWAEGYQNFRAAFSKDPIPCDIARIALAATEIGVVTDLPEFIASEEIEGPLKTWIGGANAVEWMVAAAALLKPDSGHASPAIDCSIPDWMWAELSTGRSEDTVRSVATALLEGAPVTLRVNTLRCSMAQAKAALTNAGIEFRTAERAPQALHLAKRIAPEALKGYAEGWFEFQDEASQLASIFASPLPGEIVIDACAGGGGKALHMAALMGNKGRIIACDTYAARLEPLGERRTRAGATIIERGKLDRQGDPIGAPPADLIFIDAPCSGTGTMRRSPELRWRLRPEQIDRLNAVQADLIRRWSRSLKPGGRIVYATCSLLARENDDIVDTFIAAVQAKGETEFMEDGPRLRLSPDADGCDGFFAAKLHRTK